MIFENELLYNRLKDRCLLFFIHEPLLHLL